MAASLGFEPRQRDPESLVLPLHHEATSGKIKDRSALAASQAQSPSTNSSSGDLFSLEQDLAALPGTFNFETSSTFCDQFTSEFHH